MDTKIYDIIKQVLDRNILDEKLKKYICNCMLKKQSEGFLFSQLIEIHYKLFGGDSEGEIINISAALECLLLSLDIIDDIQDEDDISSSLFDMENANLLNVSTLLMFISQQLLNECSSPFKKNITTYYTTLTMRGIEGQHLDINNVLADENNYIDMVGKKSGSFTALAALIGTALATDVYPYSSILDYSIDIGIASQLLNDAIDIQRIEEKNDIFKKKITLPIIFILGHPNSKLKLLKSYVNEEINYDNLLLQKQTLLQEITDSKAIEYTMLQREFYLQRALNTIESINFPRPELKPRLIEFVKGR